MHTQSTRISYLQFGSFFSHWLLLFDLVLFRLWTGMITAVVAPIAVSNSSKSPLFAQFRNRLSGLDSNTTEAEHQDRQEESKGPVHVHHCSSCCCTQKERTALLLPNCFREKEK